MVATVGSISIDLSTNTAKFTQGFKASATTVEQQSKRMSNAVNGFAKASAGMLKSFAGGFVGGIVGSLGIGTLEGALGKATEALHRFEDIGIKAKASGLNVEFFQALSFAANETDVEQETLNKSMEIFAKNMGLAKEGSGALYSGLLKLNPELLRTLLTAGDQETRLKAVADAMKQTTDATGRAALAVAVFGKGGADMVRVMEGGATALNDFAKEAQRLGIVFTEDDIKRWGEAADRVDRLGFVWNIKFAKILADSAPIIEGTIGALADFTTKVNELGGATDAFISKPSTKTFMEMLFGGKGTILGGFKEWADGTSRVANAQEHIQDEIKITNDELTRLFAVQKQGLFNVDQQIVEQLQKLNDLKQAWGEAGDAAAVSADKMTHAALRHSDLAALNAAGGLPTVHHGVDTASAVDEDVMDDVEAAIDKETEATKGTTRAVERTTGAVQSGFADLGGGFRDIGTALRSIPWNQRTSAANNMTDSGSGFRFSGLGSSSSWGGRRMTFGGSGSSGMSAPFGRPYRVGSDTVTDASTITSGGGTSGNINVNVVVKPVLEGQRLSAQSTAEIKQAAAAGANAALRAYHGR